MARENQLNVLGGPIETCGLQPLTGFLRDGHCRMPPGDVGQHGVCSQVTKAFLDFTRARGNDLTTPIPHHGFPGLNPGDRWCLCALRWKEALENGVAPPVILASTHVDVLQHVSLDQLKRHAI